MRMFTWAILLFIVACALSGCTTTQLDPNVPKLDLAYGEVVHNPYKWTMLQLSDGPISGKNMTEYAKIIVAKGLLHSRVDLNADDKAELLVRRDGVGRVAEVLVFTSMMGGYRYIGHFQATTIVPGGKKMSALVYEACGGHDGYIKDYRNKGRGFFARTSQGITAGDGAPEENNQYLARLFPEDKTVKWTKVPDKLIGKK
jgi:hypothetical protein